MIPTWLAIVLINLLCGVTFGVALMRSDAEAAKTTTRFLPFGRGSLAALFTNSLVYALLEPSCSLFFRAVCYCGGSI